MTQRFKNARRLAGALALAIGASAAQAGSFDDFFRAVRVDDARTLSELLARGFDPNTRDEKGQPGLTIAIQENAAKVIAELVARKDVDVNALNAAGESPLMIAALRGEGDVARSLLDHGAQIDKSGWSPLHYAATGPDVKLVQLLLDRGAPIEAASPNGSTPLMMAAQYGPEDSVKLLLQRGADPGKRNQLGLNAADFARRSGRAEVATLVGQAQQRGR